MGYAPVVALVAIAGVAMLGIAAARPATPRVARLARDTTPTFAADVAPIIYRNCASCHHPGGTGPFSLVDYDSAKVRLNRISRAVGRGTMPPWHADGPSGVFANDRRMSAEEKETILRWIATGAQLGDSTRLPPKPTFSSDWEIGTPDAVVSMPEEFHVPASGTVEYQYFEVPTNFTEEKWVQAIEVKPGARPVVHHVLVFARVPAPPRAPSTASAPPTPAPQPTAPGAPAAARPAPKPVLVFDANQRIDDAPRADTLHAPPKALGALIGSTAPGTNVVRFPEGTALRIPPGAVLTFQMHYTAKGHDMNDRTSVGFKFAKEPPAEQILATAFFNAQLQLPAGAKDVMVPSSVGFNEAVRVYGLLPHTHLRGTRWLYTLEKPDGTSETILDVPRYDFNWQTFYLFAKPLEVPAGARIVSKAWYDNSAGNKHNPDPNATVKWGDQTWEEMQYTGILYSVNSRRRK